MSGGPNQLVINTRERAVSNDIMRAQAFADAALGGVLQYIFDGTANEDDAAGVVGITESVGSPPSAIIFGGCQARPEVGTTNLYVDPCVIGFTDVDSPVNPDDSYFKIITDPGVTNVGQLTLTPNTSGSVRIDVIEVSRLPNQVLATDNRDIFDPTTGLFTATTVTKVQADQLAYRIRPGTPGAGFPGVVSGWLPIAVASVPNTATNWDACDVWDVRPLASDLARSPFNIKDSAYPFVGRRSVQLVQPTTQSTFNPWNYAINATGRAEMVLGYWLIGGNLAPGTSPLNINTTQVLEPTFYSDFSGGLAGFGGAFPQFNVDFVCLYLATFFGLPRWARYTPATSGSRKPMSPRGVPIFSCKWPGPTGAPSAAIGFPSAFGFGSATTTTARMVFAVPCPFSKTPSFQPANLWLNEPGDHRFAWGGDDTSYWSFAGQGNLGLGGDYMIQNASTTIDTTHGTYVTGTFSLVDNVTHPITATTLHLRLYMQGFQITGSANAESLELQVTCDDGSGNIMWAKRIPYQSILSTHTGLLTPVEFDVNIGVNMTTTPRTQNLVCKMSAPQSTLGSPGFIYESSPLFGSLDVLGWSLRA
jgi:hypothetical protein